MKHDRVYPVSKTQKSRKQIAYLFFLCKYTQNIQDTLYIKDLTIFQLYTIWYTKVFNKLHFIFFMPIGFWRIFKHYNLNPKKYV